MTDLTPLQSLVFNIFKAKPETDISVTLLYHLVYEEGADWASGLSNRAMQQKLGPLISRINCKLDGHQIVPGKLKQTYRLDPKD